MVLVRNQNWNFKEYCKNILVVIQYMQCLIEIGKRKDIILVKKKATGFIFLTGLGFCEAEGNLKMGSCLQDAVINSAPRIGKLLTSWNYTDSALLEE